MRELERLLAEERFQPHRLADLAVDGADLLRVGFVPGPALGRALQQLLDDVVEEPALNTSDELTRRARLLLEKARA